MAFSPIHESPPKYKVHLHISPVTASLLNMTLFALESRKSNLVTWISSAVCVFALQCPGGARWILQGSDTKEKDSGEEMNLYA